MKSIQPIGNVPVSWHLDGLPEVEDSRPSRCPRCLAPARQGSRISLHGHGVRVRGVVVPAALDGRMLLAECWCRRYRCTACGSVTTVLPIGVMPRFLYSVFAIVLAFTLVAAEPIGRELTDARAYARQGMNPLRAWHHRIDWRWQSLVRWQGRFEDWWPGLPTSIEGLLTGLVRRAGSTDPPAVLAAAVASHGRWGAGM